MGEENAQRQIAQIFETSSARGDGTHQHDEGVRSRPSIIINGLKVKQKHQTTPWSFSYALSPGTKSPSFKGWWHLITEDEETENIRLYQLVEGQELSSLFDGFKYTKAVILVNTEDHYELPGCFVKEFPFCLLVMKRTDGEEILKRLEFLEGQHLYASVGQLSDVETASQQMDEVAKEFPKVDGVAKVAVPIGFAKVPIQRDGLPTEGQVARASTEGDQDGVAEVFLEGDGVAKDPLEGYVMVRVPTEVDGMTKVSSEGRSIGVAKLPSGGSKVAKLESLKLKGSPEGNGVAKFPSEGSGAAKGSPEGDGVAKLPSEGSMAAKGSPEGDGVAKLKGSPEGDGVAKLPSEVAKGSPEGERVAKLPSEGSMAAKGSPEGDGVAKLKGSLEGKGVPSEGSGVAKGSPEGDGVAKLPSEGNGIAKGSPEWGGVVKLKGPSEGGGVAELPSEGSNEAAKGSPEGDGVAKLPSSDGNGAAKRSPEGNGLTMVTTGSPEVAKIATEGDGMAKVPPEGNDAAEVHIEECGVERSGVVEGSLKGDGVAKVPSEGNKVAEGFSEEDAVANVSMEVDEIAKRSPEGNEVAKVGNEANRVSSDEDEEYKMPPEELPSPHRKEDGVHLQRADVDNNPQGSDVDVLPQGSDVDMPQGTSRGSLHTKATQQQSGWKWPKWPWTSKQGADPGTSLAAEIKKYMFSHDSPKIMTKNRMEFKQIFRAFCNIPAKNLNDVMKKLRAHMASTYNSDFLFHILLLYLLRTMYPYEEEVKKTTINFLDDFEWKLSPKEVAAVVKDFIQDGDLDVDVYNEERSAFHLLQDACFNLAYISYKLRGGGDQNTVYKNFLFSGMLWLSIGMKFCEVCGTSSMPDVHWERQIIKFCPFIELNTDTIFELHRGLHLGRCLHLSAVYAFNDKCLRDLLAKGGHVRPFHQHRDCLLVIKDYVSSGKELMIMFSEIRGICTSFMAHSLKVVSKRGDVRGCLEEGINFVNILYFNTNSDENDREFFDSEFHKWLMLLLKIVDPTEPNSSAYFKLFSEGRESVLETYRDIIENSIKKTIQKRFSHLKLSQFLNLFKSFKFWTSEDVHKFLLEYNIPHKTRLFEPIWTEFITAVASRFKHASKHKYLVDFLFLAGQKYVDQVNFIVDLLKLRVENLLTMASLQDQEVRKVFSDRLRQHIKKDNILQQSLIARMPDILGSIYEMNNFQLLVLDVLQDDVVPELKITDAKIVLQESIPFLQATFPNQTSLSTKQRFSFAILSACCSKIIISTKKFRWAQHYGELQLGQVFETYCKWKQLPEVECVMATKLHEEVQTYSSEDVLKYFRWMAELQGALQHWNVKFQEDNVNYEEITLYEITLPILNEKVYPVSLLMSCENVEKTKTAFLHNFEMLNVLLLCYIPGQPDIQSCSLPALLEKYGVCLPQEAQGIISRNVVFPDQERQIPVEELSPSLNPSVTKRFIPGNEIALKLRKCMTLSELQNLVKVLQNFQNKLSHLDMLVFFKLNKSDLFNNFLQHYLEKFSRSQQNTAAGAEFLPPGVMSPYIVAPASTHDLVQGSHLQNLSSALNSTSNLFDKIRSGTATYFDVTAEDTLVLQQLDFKREFAILSMYLLQGSPSSNYSEELKGVQSMLELFQYTKHVETIQAVCEQYHLEKCTSDPLLKELVLVHASFANRSNLTPKEAAQIMDRVKEILLLGGNKSRKYLDIFAAIRDSAAFYQFVKDKQFEGPQGQANFLQQYQLITAQLQHEEYDEQVLNHLRAAFKVISPFMNVDTNFSELIEEVVSLDAVNGHKQLETVNTNITLIRLWFSRAEGDTLENVAKELDCIIGTGKYTFHLGGEESESSHGKMFLDYDFHDTSHSQTDPGKVHREMSDEQIRDFVRRLGFLDNDKDEDVAKKIKHFLHLSQTISRLLELYLKLRELGHSDYLTDDRVHPIPCSMCKEDLESIVQEAQHSVTKWNHEVSELHTRFSWLLYLSVPKILQLYQLINASDAGEKVDKIIHEVSFLMSNLPNERNKMQSRVLDVLLETVHQEPSPSVSSPMLIVGQFLDAFFKNHILSWKNTVKMTNDFAQPLYSCPIHHSRLGFLTLILSIFSGIPKAYQVLHCKASTTEEELTRFLKRVEKHRGHYLMLDVNRLPFKLQEVLVQVHFGMQRVRGESEYFSQDMLSIVHFVETAPSILHEMPWILVKDSKDYFMSSDEAKELCKQVTIGFSCIEVVYGEAGNGKSHYIKKQLAKCSDQLTISISEAFSPLGAITMLRFLPLYKGKIGLFFNFTLLPPDNVEKNKMDHYSRIMEVVGWFFFNLLLLGYVEDPNTGLSFCLPRGLEWSIYIEVPCHNQKSAEECVRLLFNEVPTLNLLGSLHFIDAGVPYDVDDDVQLICKYLQAYKQQEIDILYDDENKILVKFSQDPFLPEEDCHRLLKEYMPKHAAAAKITQRLFIRYMKRRCDFLDCLPAFNYNEGSGEYIIKSGKKIRTNTKKLGSTLMETMLKEVSDFCDPSLKEKWSMKPHQQLVYDFKDRGGSFGLISLHPGHLNEADKEKFAEIGVVIPSMADLYSRNLLDSYLSRALQVKLNNGRLTAIDDSAYVLTLDYAIKMLDIHERFMCGVPVIIEGETGVGKTALMGMLSKLWNHSLLLEWEKQQSNLLEFFCNRLSVTSSINSSDDYQEYFEAVAAMSNGDVSFDSVLLICNHSDAAGKFYSLLNKHVLSMRDNAVVPFLVHKTATPMETLFEEAEQEDTPEATAHLILAILQAQVEPTFHKINVHTAMTPTDVKRQFEPVLSQARTLQKRSSTTASPFVTVFLDEVNTSSCLGLFKEIIVDRTCDGITIPDNVFIVAACNPHRGNSLASHKTWTRGTYYVRSLHPTLKLLMWDYGSLDEYQERDYINAKMMIMNTATTNSENLSLANLIVESQIKMREFACRQLEEQFKAETDQAKKATALLSARSCVSQRDIQRIFTFYQWFIEMFKKCGRYIQETYHLRAVLLTLGLVYYMRLNADHRKEYAEYLDNISKKVSLSGDITFTTALNDELDYYISEIELPKGIARTLALKENLFATIVCTATHTPLIIVGAPGSSKTLSFNQAISNLRGQESKKDLFRNTEIFRSLDPHYYQCSRRTTSREIETVFSRAINRQRSHTRFELPIYCVVFMDEAGLPEESHESLKVLHYHLDNPEVSFVAITNHILDAAKTNRAISLFRPEASKEDLETLAKECLCSDPEYPPREEDLDTVVKFCMPYSECMQQPKFSHFFGLRDFIHFVNYLRRKRDKNNPLSLKVVVQAVERNFNGFDVSDHFPKFFEVLEPHRDISLRHILEVMRDSMKDRPQDWAENEVRYKLLIDPSEDDSLVRLLFSFDVLERENTRIFMCSDFPEDGEIQNVNTIAAIRHSAFQGHTVVLSQTDDIHESFYDLFNQRFRRINDPELKQGARYYANIAIGSHSKPCRVDPNFQCVVVMKKSEVMTTPGPFLNRFEKYLISHESLLQSMLQHFPPYMATMIQAVKEKVNSFIYCILKEKSFYGLQPETLDSLILDFLPPINYKYKAMRVENENMASSSNMEAVPVYLFREVLKALRTNAGFYIPKYPNDELLMDVDHVFSLIVRVPKFNDLLKDLTHQDAIHAVAEAFNLLHSSSDSLEEVLTPDGSMVVSILLQVFVRLLIKKLMNLMTTEAVVLYHNKIPSLYLENYLSNQEHFSLKNAISNYHTALHATMHDPCVGPSKVVCFTRSSPLVHILPARFPHVMAAGLSKVDRDIILEHTKRVTNLVFEAADKVMVHKLSNLLSQNSVQELLNHFFSSSTAEVCVLLANMQVTTRKMINHIRVMIEEAELKRPAKICKVFVLLLHFTPAQFYQHCYPSLFLRGWDHCYLDTVAHSQVEGVVDIQDWFVKCCFPSDQPINLGDTLMQALNHILHEIIFVLSARTYSGNKEDKIFNSTMNATQRGEILRTLLFKKGVGKVLCEKFRAYWKPKVMADYLERVGTFSQQRESTLNITDSIQAHFKALFVDFCVYMLTKANRNFNLDTAFDDDPNIHKLFIEIFRVLPVPKLQQLNLLSNDLTSHQPPAYCPRFPFFNYVYELMEKQLDLSGGATDRKLNLLTHKEKHMQGILSISPLEKERKLITSVLTDLKSQSKQQHTGQWSDAVSNTSSPQEGPKQVLKLVLDAMASQQDIWMHYFDDFIVFKLKSVDSSDVPQGDITLQLLRILFEGLHILGLPLRMVQLHCYASIHHVFLAQWVTKFRPLSKIEEMQQEVLSPISSPTRVTDEFVQTMKLTKSPLGNHVSSFVINTLFNILTVAGLSTPEKQKLDLWSKSYRDIMSLPFYYSHCVCDDDSLRAAMLNVMQATFVTLKSAYHDGDTLSKGHQTFIFLYSQYFKKMMQENRNLLSILPSECSELKSPTDHPDLAKTMKVTVEVVSSSGSAAMCIPHYDTPIWLARDGLMAHYFSPARQKLSHGDVKWFLDFANMPRKWRFQRDSEVTLKGDWTGEQGKSAYILQTEDLLPPGTNLLKFYLGLILCKEEQPAKPLQLYPQHFRAMIGEVLMQSENLGDAGPYVPFFYQIALPDSKQTSDKNLRMQQSLCHLYFLTVMEHLQSKHHIPSRIVEFASAIQSQLETAKEGEAVVLWVELQAVVQVLIKQLAMYIDPSQPHKIGDVTHIMDDINNILDNPADMAQQHGMVLALHFMKLQKSLKEYIFHLSYQFDHLKGINCIKSLRQELLLHPTPELKPHLFSFLHDGTKEKLETLYNCVLTLMVDIHKQKIESMELLQFCISEDSPDRRCTIKMVLWLATYYEFYDKKIASPILCSSFEDRQMSDYISDEGCICLIRCFLEPSHRLCKGSSNPGDRLYQLFDPYKTEELDTSELDLRYSLANLVAVVLGKPQHSSHLWYHLFAPQNLENSYITGFMYDFTVHRDRDCGVEPTADGEFAFRGTHTLHSLYLLLWANFGSFCMGLLTQPDSYQHISENLSLREFCVNHLKNLWKHLSNNLNLLEEQRSFFIMSALARFHHLVWTDTPPASNTQGIFRTQEELDCYERMWHTGVFKPALDELTLEFPNQYCNEKIRQLYIHYPHFPKLEDFSRSIRSSGDLDEHSEGGRLWLLLKFVTEWQCLQVGGVLLPPLVELYQWIHTDLAYLLTREQASHYTIGQLIAQAENKLDKQSRESIRKVYNEVKQKYNDFLPLTTEAVGTTAAISDTKPLLDFLTDGQGKDMLYVIIALIIKTHNKMIESFYSVHAKRLPYVLPEKPAEISPRETTLEDAIPSCKLTEIHEVSSFLQLVRSRYHPSVPAFHSQLPFQLDKLEEDIASNFIVGKPLIGSPSQLRKVFKFNVAQDLAEQLPDKFKITLHETLLKKFEYEFHSADYHLMAEVVTALRTILGHLIKALEEGREDFEELALKFVLNLHKHLESEDQALQEIGVRTESKPYLDCLINLPLAATYHCFKLFSNWVDEGFYDFNTLPFQVKVRMSKQDKLSLEEVCSKWTRPVFELMKELQHLIDLLKQSEEEIISQVDSAACKSILDYLTEKKFEKEKYLFVDFIPDTIMLRHYVYFRLVLRRVLLEVQEKLKKRKHKGDVNIWSEFADDLWDKHFPHLREELYGRGLLPEISQYGFQESEKDDEMDNFVTAVLKEATCSVPEVCNVPQHYADHEDDVAHFLTNIGLPQYADEFKDNQIDGELLLKADSDVLSELGVESLLHQMKIMQLFPRELLGTKVKYSNDHLSQFLQQQEKLIKYIPVLKKHGIDGDMVLHVEENLMKGVLKEIGISPVASLKICVNYKKFVNM